MGLPIWSLRLGKEAVDFGEAHISESRYGAPKVGVLRMFDSAHEALAHILASIGQFR